MSPESERQRDHEVTNEDRYRALLHSLSTFVWVADARGQFSAPQPGWEKFTGHGFDKHGGSGWITDVHPDDRAHVVEVWNHAVRSNSWYEVAWRCWHGATQSWRQCITRGVPVMDKEGLVREWIGSVLDFEDRVNLELKRSQSDLASANQELASNLELMKRVHQLSTRLIQAGELNTLLGEIIETALDLTGAYKGNIQLLEDGALQIIEHRGFDRAFLDYFNSVEQGKAAFGSALERKERVVVENVVTSPIFGGTPALDVLLSAGVQAVQSTPLVTRSGEMLGMLSTHYPEPQRPSERDLRVLDMLARQGADLIERSLSEQALANERLTFVTLIEQCPFGIYIVDSDFKIVQMNRRSEDGAFINVRPVIGRPLEEALRILWAEPVAAEIAEQFRRTLIAGEPFYSKDFIRPRNDVAQVDAFEWELHRVTLPSGRFGVICYYYDSTQLRETEIALRDLTHQLQQTLETVATGLTRCGRDMRYISCNAAYAALAGVSAEQIVGHPILEVMGQAAFGIIRPYVDRVLQGERVEYEAEVPWPTAGPKWIHVVYMPWREQDGSITGWVASVNDITSRKIIEESLRQSEERLRLATEHAEIGFWDVDEINGVLTWPPRVKAMFGISPDVPVSMRDFYNGLHPDDRAATTEGYAAAADPKRRALYDVEYRTIGKDDGRVRWVAAKGRGIFDHDGRCVRVIGTATDITQRKTTEAALVESETRFRQLAEVSPQFIAVITADGTVEFVNQRWTSYSGLNLDQTLDESHLAHVFHPEEHQEMLRDWQVSRASGEPFQRECRLRGAGGDFRWFMIRAVALCDEAGHVVKWFGVATDIHEQKRVEQDLRRANQDLEQFAYSASHDLQEPLRGIKIYSEVLTMLCGEKLESEALQALEFVCSGATRMELLLSGLRSYTQAARLEHPDGPVDAADCFNVALQNLSGAIAESGATIHAGVLPSVRVHSTQLQQLFQNLIGNAIKYRKPGLRPVVHVFAEEQNGQWLFAVKDNGIGIEKQYKDRVFGLFKRLHTQHEYTGTGIGLALCHRIVDHYHGRIWVESEFGEGSTFYFTLPT